MFEGLFLYEIVLLFLGVLLFLVLLFVLVFYVLKETGDQRAPFLFPIPIIMIGFPGIQEVRFGAGVVEIEKGAERLERNASDTTGRSELLKSVAELEKRPVTSPSTLVNVARVHAVAGDTLKALTYVDSALKENPRLQEALSLKKRYTPLHVAPSSLAR